MKGNKKEKDIYLTCKACGKTNIVDMSHKFCGYIQKNPPNGHATPVKSKREEKRKNGKKSKKEGGSSGDGTYYF